MMAWEVRHQPPRAAETHMSNSAPEGVSADDLLDAAQETIAAADDAGVRMRLLGGIAVYQLARSSREPSLRRTYHDFDVVVSSKNGNRAARVFRDLGYGEDREFNAVHGAQRMIYNSKQGFVVDVIVGTFHMCHRLDLGRDLPAGGVTIDPADLLLTKLQIVEIEDKDLLDAVELLIDLPVGGPAPLVVEPQRFARPLAADWGFYRTVERNLPKLTAYAGTVLDPARAEGVARSVRSLEDAMQQAPKSMKWKMRARVGERVPWYDLPEEV
jgi:hypothetical protein